MLLPGNPGKPLGFSLNWSARITSEFFAQVGYMRCALHIHCCQLPDTCTDERKGPLTDFWH